MKYVEISPIPPLGKDDASVLLMTDMTQPRTTIDFHFCRKAKFWGSIERRSSYCRPVVWVLRI